MDCFLYNNDKHSTKMGMQGMNITRRNLLFLRSRLRFTCYQLQLGIVLIQ
jgi:hypothetical protein